MTLGFMLQVSLEIWGAAICLISAFIIIFAGGKKSNRSRSLIAAESLLAVMLLTDSFYWIYAGDTSYFAYNMVRATSFLTLACMYFFMVALVHYFFAMLEDYGVFIPSLPYRCCSFVMWLNMAGLVVSQFVPLYYSFSSDNTIVWARTGILIHATTLVCMLFLIVYFARYLRHLDRFDLACACIYIVISVASVACIVFSLSLRLVNAAWAASLLIMFVSYKLQQSKTITEKAMDAAELAEQNRKMERAKLLSQIKPQFIYSTLNNIKYMCKEDKDVAEALDHFAKYLRGSIDMVDKNTPIPLYQELDTVEHFVYISKLKFHDELRVRYDIRVEHMMLPALSIQSLVEMAINMGITTSKYGGLLTIKIYEEDDNYFVSVFSDEGGFDYDDPMYEKRDSRDVESLRDRVQTMCDGSLEVHKSQEDGFNALMIIPKHRRKTV